jgi:hypothetical protein
MGRRLHSRVVILVVLAARRERSKQQITVEKLEEIYSIPVRTIVRWTAFFRHEYVRCFEWTCIQGLVSALVSRDELPGSLLEHFLAQHDDVDEGLVACASFMASGAVNVQAR